MLQEKILSRREGRRYELGWELLWGRITGKEGLIEGPEGKGLGGEDICLTHFMKQTSSTVWCKPPLVTPSDHQACLTLLPALVQVELSSGRVEKSSEHKAATVDSGAHHCWGLWCKLTGAPPRAWQGARVSVYRADSVRAQPDPLLPHSSLCSIPFLFSAVSLGWILFLC